MKCSVERNVAHQLDVLKVKIRLDRACDFVLPVLGQRSGHVGVTWTGKYIKIMWLINWAWECLQKEQFVGELSLCGVSVEGHLLQKNFFHGMVEMLVLVGFLLPSSTAVSWFILRLLDLASEHCINKMPFGNCTFLSASSWITPAKCVVFHWA